MNISSRCEYACRAAIELAIHEQSDVPITATTIAEKRFIPAKYLVHILLQLKRAGIVRSLRGASGGYMLARAAETISLYDVISAVEGPILDPLPAGNAGSEELSLSWQAVSGEVAGVLKRTTIRTILDRAEKANMYYI